MKTIFLRLRRASNVLGILGCTFKYLLELRRPGVNAKLTKLRWANEVLARLYLSVEVVGRPSRENSLLFVGSHASYLDIPLLLSLVPDVSFVAKKQIARWPVIGAAARATETVFIDRGKKSAGAEIRLALARNLHDKKRMVLFPSGTTSEFESKPWRKGRFEVAAEASCKVQPFRVAYRPSRLAAYIDRDFFIWHLFKLSFCDDLRARIEFHEPVSVTSPVQDAEYWRRWAARATTMPS